MAFPVHSVTLPAVLAGQTNGRLPDSILVDTPGQAGGYTVRLVAPAARAWRALCAAALAAGHVLKPSGPLDSYRPYDQQLREFTSRFVTYNTGTGVTKVWQGKTYWLKPGVALAATPGKSNHGLGLAVDVGVELDGDAGTESIDDATLAWLVANEHLYGWSHEVQSEPWHIHYFTGDAIPAAVLAYEQSTVEEDMAVLARLKGDSKVYLCNGITRRFVASEQELADIRESAKIGLIAPLANGGEIFEAFRLDALGTLVGPDPDAKPLPAVEVGDVDLSGALAKALTDPSVLAAIAKAVNDDNAARMKA